MCILQTVSHSHVYAQCIGEPTVSILYDAGVKIYSITVSDVKTSGTQVSSRLGSIRLVVGKIFSILNDSMILCKHLLGGFSH